MILGDSMDTNYVLGKIIRATREQLEYTQETLCNGKLSRRTLIRIESGKGAREDSIQYVLYNLGLDNYYEVNFEPVNVILLETYKYILDLDFERAGQELEKLLKLNQRGCYFNEIKEVCQQLANYYLDKKCEAHDKYLQLMDIYPEHLQILVKDYIFKTSKKDSENIKLNESMLYGDDIILKTDYIQHLLANDKWKEALCISEDLTETCIINHLYNRALRLMQIQLQIKFNGNDKDFSSFQEYIYAYMQEYNELLHKNSVDNIYYQMGAQSILKKNYVNAIRYFEKSIEGNVATINECNCLNFCYLREEPQKFMECYELNDEKYVNGLVYKYFKCKSEMITNGDIDYIILSEKIATIINDKEIIGSLTGFLIYQEAAWIDRMNGNRKLYYKITRLKNSKELQTN